jgi:hypothetical protein
MSARFWWAVRRVWHTPHMFAMRAYTTFPPLAYRRHSPRLFWLEFRLALWEQGVRALARVARRTPFCCNGDRPTFRFTVTFCDWLERKARHAEGDTSW